MTRLRPEYRVVFRLYAGVNVVALCAIVLLHLGNRVWLHVELYSMCELFFLVNLVLSVVFILLCLQRLDVWDDKIVYHTLGAKNVIMCSNIVGVEKGEYRGVVNWVDILYRNRKHREMAFRLLCFDQSRVLEALVHPRALIPERESRAPF